MRSFVDVLDTHELRRKFNCSGLPVRDFLVWAWKTSLNKKKDIMRRMEEKLSGQKFDRRKSHNLSEDNLLPRELGAEQTDHVLRAPLPIHTDAIKENLI